MAPEAQCDSCGETNPAGSSFCLFCGTYLGWDQPGKGPTEAVAGPQEPAGGGTSPPSATSRAPVDDPGPTPPPPRPVTDPTTRATPPAAPAGAAGSTRPTSAEAGPRCPACGHANPVARRFCERCGFALTTASPSAPSRPRAGDGSAPRWWQRSAEERSARRAYRRSLPPLYRWRRVIVVVLVLLLAVAVVSVVEGNPVEWATDRYHDVRGSTEKVPGVEAVAEPGGEPVPAATDADASSTWKTPWPADTADQTCAAPRAGALRLQWADPVRVRGVRISPGTRPGGSVDRRLSPRPATLLVSWEDASGELRCESLEVADVPDTRDLEVDTETEVDTLWLRIGSVHAAQGATAPRPVAVRYLAVLARP
jgi:hypothetical protein